MKNILLFSLVLVTLISCEPSQSSQASQSVSIKDFKNADKYVILTSDANENEFVGKKVQFNARICDFEMQHMLRPSLVDDAKNYICIDRIDKKGERFGQMLAYKPNVDELYKHLEDKTFTVYGTLAKISGAGKGGGTHTEYYLELDKAE